MEQTSVTSCTGKDGQNDFACDPPAETLSIGSLDLSNGLRMLIVLAAVALAAGIATPPSPCDRGTIALSLDDGGGEFNGMSHAGTRLIVRNTGMVACRFPMRPGIVFKDAKQAGLPVIVGERRKALPGVIQISEPGALGSALIVTLSPGQSVSTTLRWISGDVYGRGQGRCVHPRAIELYLQPANVVDLPFKGDICGERGKMITVDRSPWEGVKP